MGYDFSKQLGLDSFFTSWDLRKRIPRRKLPYSLIPRSKLANPGQIIMQSIV